MPLVNQLRHAAKVPSFEYVFAAKSQKSPLLVSLNHYLESHLNEPNLNIAHLIRTLCVSRASLHRKLVAATGMNTTNYICHFRIKQATKLLEKEPDLSIFEIAIAVGFNSQSYFTKKFKEVFGRCPNKYRRDRINGR